MIDYLGDYLRESGGKRVRPALLVLASYAVGGDGASESSILLATVILSRWDSVKRDAAYEPLLQAAPLAGFRFDEPLTPHRFATVSRIYRRKPRADIFKDLEAK